MLVLLALAGGPLADQDAGEANLAPRANADLDDDLVEAGIAGVLDLDVALDRTADGPISDRLAGQFVYGLTTSSGMIGLIVCMVGGVLTTVVAMLFGVDSGASIWIGVAGGLLVIAVLFAYTGVSLTREQARFTALFPTPTADAVPDQQ